MKTKYWIMAISALLLVCILLSLLWMWPSRAAGVEIWSEGKLLYRLELSREQVITVESAHGTNVIEISNGTVAVTHADCPDGWCVAMGRRSGGVQIVCLPNELVIRFTQSAGVDGVSG